MPKQTPDIDRMMRAKQARQINLAEWRKNQIHEQDLPSGLHVKLRDVTMTDLALTGKLPDPIIDMAMDTAKNGGQELDLKTLVKNAGEFNQMLDVLIKLCLVEPRIGDVADDEHITMSEFPSDDKMAIFNFINREAEKIHPFREGET